ncbi:hypothetical protein RO624_03850 [Ruminococcus bromii]|jgi:hypothetical protein|nr:hypothetical protein [Ruminococcus bromii]MDT4341251.1 hypothetical protein [Ruminococcus bromii]
MIDCSKTKNYLSEQARMTKSSDVGVCRISCNHCPLSRFNNGEEMLCTELELTHPEKAIEIVQRWSDKHPQKTYLSELLKHFPKVELSDKGVPKLICPHDLGLNEIEDCDGTDNYCAECWNQSIKKGEK